ncbi:MAG: hypothetical protein KKE76_08200 [Gammaproteobacteria bacterium]|nr:hypothetical protein [Gammaproteobacteria bacterium]
MHDEDNNLPPSIRNYEKRRYRHRQLYWRAMVPITVLLVAGHFLGYLTEALLLAAVGALVVLLVMLREIIDVLGYIGCLQRDAALERESIRSAVAELKKRSGSDEK